jgi:hypothetical protein
LTTSAFLNPKGFESGDGKVAIQIINNGNLATTFPIAVKGVGNVKKVTTYLLDNHHRLDVVSDILAQTGPATWSASLAAFSMITVVLDY